MRYQLEKLSQSTGLVPETEVSLAALIKQVSSLPTGVRPRGLSRPAAAAYIGVSQSLFDEMIRDGRMPKPKLANTRTIWDIVELDAAFDALPTRGVDNPWDASYG
jgi:predicted DNA-binding transcriptional regulator AlpA